MNKKFFLAAGAVILTAAGAFAGRMSLKSNAIQLFATVAGACKQVTGTFSGTGTLTIGGSGAQATITSVNSASHNLFATSACNATSAVHYHA